MCSINANVNATSTAEREKKPVPITGRRGFGRPQGAPVYFKSFVFPVTSDIFFNLQINQFALKLTLFPLFSQSVLAAETEKKNFTRARAHSWRH